MKKGAAESCSIYTVRCKGFASPVLLYFSYKKPDFFVIKKVVFSNNSLVFPESLLKVFFGHGLLFHTFSIQSMYCT